MSASVNISVEAPLENTILEIGYDGQEIYQPPLSMSDNLTRLASKIDFSKTNVGAEESSFKKEDSPDEEREQAATWPWDSVKQKLNNALTEVCVLAGVLSIAKEKRYMVLDPIPQDTMEQRAMVHVFGRKKALAGAAATLLAGVERLRGGDSLRSARNMPDFHIDLLRLRQNWRLKKVSNAIIGDLSYRTAGSKFVQTGLFEVTKAPEDAIPTPVPGMPGAAVLPQPSALRVTVPAELQGVAFISVLCQKDQEELLNCQITTGVLGIQTGNASSTQAADLYWQQKLEAAQNVLFCKELFGRLACEAVQLKSPIPHLVVENQIMATILPGIQLIIGLCHSNGQGGGDSSAASTPAKQKSDHEHVLEHSLHQLLRQAHHANTNHPCPHPASGPLGPSKRRCLAGPMAADRYELIDMSKQQTLLEQIIQQAQHFFMRRRTEYVLDTIAKEVKDPLIVSHWSVLNSPTQSCVKIYIITHGYDAVCRTPLVIHVGEKTLKCIGKDGKVMHMSYEPQELRDLIYCQIHQHQMLAFQAIGRCMGWQFLAGSLHLGSGPVEPLGNASYCLMASPNGDRMISVRCEPSSGIQVSIAQSPRKDFFAGQLVQERKWEHLGGTFKEVRLDKMEGKNFLNKMELLMASLSSSS